MDTLDRRPPVFAAGPYRALELRLEEAPLLQRFYETNPEYFVNVGGRPATPSAAVDDFTSTPPEGWPYTREWMLGFVCPAAPALAGMSNVVSDLLAEDVWHIGLFIIATSLHGTGAAAQIYAGLESWLVRAGARWARLGVVAGNARAERFWARRGYVEVSRRDDVEIDERSNTVRIMVKALAKVENAAAEIHAYLERVPRDRPQ